MPLPKVVDADALNRIAGCPALLPSRDLCGTMVLTPHEGEAARLEHAFGISSGGGSREERAAALSRATGCVVLLKGAGTLVAEPGGSLTVNTSGNPRLATAGTGDVLSTALRRQPRPAWEHSSTGSPQTGRSASSQTICPAPWRR